MTIDKTFDGIILCTTHREFDVKGKMLRSNRSDATENILALFKEPSGFHPCEGPDQRRRLIVCDNFKGKKILFVQENKRNVYPWETNMFSDQPVRCYLTVLMSRIDLKSSNQTVLTCAGILFCSVIFVFLSNVKQRDS